jgi:NAD(P)-dependent dehydrogenase (short-subunit alcohol dehydrogenase family)
MSNGRYGRVICMGPPLPKTYKSYAGKTAYYMSKCGMTMVALGAAAEGEKMGAGTNVTGNSLWPATIVESLASENFQLGDRKYWRKASILADCVTQLCAPGMRGDWSGARSTMNFFEASAPSTPTSSSTGATRASSRRGYWRTRAREEARGVKGTGTCDGATSRR